MALRTIFELAARSDDELRLLYKQVLLELALLELTSGKKLERDKRDAQATLQNIRRVIGARPPGP